MGVPSNNGYFTEQTLFKVYDALRDAGLDEAKARDCINDMQNRGLLFRERPPQNLHQSQVTYRGDGTAHRDGGLSSIAQQRGD